MGNGSKASDDLSEVEATVRFDATLKRMLATPHKPHQPIKKKVKESQPK